MGPTVKTLVNDAAQRLRMAGVEGPRRDAELIAAHVLGIDRALNARPATAASGLHLEDHGIVAPRARVIVGPRVGVDYAGPVWAAKPWRFRIAPEDLRRPVR